MLAFEISKNENALILKVFRDGRMDLYFRLRIDYVWE